MVSCYSNNRQASLFWDLETMLDPKHPLFKLANMVNWSCFEEAFAPLFCADNGRPPKPIRLMVGLLMLKHLRNVSDELIDYCHKVAKGRRYQGATELYPRSQGTETYAALQGQGTQQEESRQG